MQSGPCPPLCPVTPQGPLFPEVQPDTAGFPLALHTCGRVIRRLFRRVWTFAAFTLLKPQLEYYLFREVSLTTLCEVASLVTFQPFLPP